MMKITGYSERGALNSLLYEIAYSSHPEQLLADLLATAHFPQSSPLPLQSTMPRRSSSNRSRISATPT